MIDVPTLDGASAIPVYRADPDSTPAGAVIVIQEIFGVNAGIREKADQWAALGYLALAPDLFWRIEPGIELDPDRPEELQTAFGHMQRFDTDQGIRDLEATIRFARAAAGKVGVIGYCMGGKIAYLAATRTDCDAAVGYYGAGIDALLGEAHAIANPLLLHFAEQDHFIGEDVRARIAEVLGDNPHVAIHSYAGVDHGFATTHGARRDDAAAKVADARTAAFFERALR